MEEKSAPSSHSRASHKVVLRITPAGGYLGPRLVREILWSQEVTAFAGSATWLPISFEVCPVTFHNVLGLETKSASLGEGRREAIDTTNRRDLESVSVLHNCPLIRIDAKMLVFKVVSFDLKDGFLSVFLTPSDRFHPDTRVRHCLVRTYAAAQCHPERGRHEQP